MKNTIKVTSLITLVAAVVLAVSVATVSGARADEPPPPPGGSSWGMASPIPTPPPTMQIAPISPCILPGTCLPPNIGDNIELAPTPTPQPPTGGGSWGMASPTPTPQPPTGSGSWGMASPTPTPQPPSSPTPTPQPPSTPAPTPDTGNSGSTGGPNSPGGSSNVAGATNAPAPDKSSDASLPNAGTGTGSSATGGTQSDLILVGLVIAGLVIALALFFTAWRMRRVRS
jgi:hypothetical protein